MSYQNSIIYKIECNDTKIKECYIGSTVDFAMRGRRHKHNCKRSNSKVYKFIRENGGWKNWSMKSIINYPCNSKSELHIKEQEIIKSYHNTLNMVSAFRSIEDKIEYFKQYYIDNAEKKKEYDKKYNIDNAEKIKIHQSEKIQCECGRLISRRNIVRHRKTKKHKSFFSIMT